MKETRVSYLNEDDKPKVEKPLDFIEWYKKHGECNLVECNNISDWHTDILNEGAAKYAEYRNNFKPNDKPIELFDINMKASDFNLIVVHKGGKEFTCFTDSNHRYSLAGNLNNGKVK